MHNRLKFESDGLQQQKTTPVLLLSAKNKKLRQKFAHHGKMLSDLMSTDFSESSVNKPVSNLLMVQAGVVV